MTAVIKSHYSRRMEGFTKLFSSIIHSTIWREDMHVKVLWVTMLAMANKDGRVLASLPGLADAARISIDQCKDALSRLLAPDEFSRTKDFEGRRIEEVDGGWALLNYTKYREMRDSDERRIQVREAVRRHREKKSGVIKGNQCKPRKAQAEAEAENVLTPFVRSEGPASQESPASSPRKPLQQDLLSSRLDVDALFERWKKVHGHPEAKLTEKRAKAIKARLKDSTVDELNLAIDGCKASAWHQGENDRGKVFDDIELIFRDREHVEQFMREARGAPPAAEETEAELEARLWKDRERDREEGRIKREAFERERDAALAMPYPGEIRK